MKIKKIIELSVFSLIGIITIIAGSLFFYQITYASKIYRNVYFANIDLSNKTKEQAVTEIKEEYNKVLNREFILSNSQGEVKTKLADTGLGLDIDKIVKNCYNVGRNKGFFSQIVGSTKTLFGINKVPIEPEIDNIKYDNFLKIAVTQLNLEPQNATIEIQNGRVVIIPERNGQIVDTTDLITKIIELADNEEINRIELNNIIEVADVKSVDFADAKQTANSIMGKTVTLSYGEKSFVPSRIDKGNWIKFSNDDGEYTCSLDDGNIQAYLNKIAGNLEIQKKDTKINATDESLLEEGVQGLYIDKADAIKQIKNQITNHSVTITLNTYTVDPVEIKVFPAEGIVPGRFEGKYIDIDITQQKLCRIEGQNIIDCFTVSSGKSSTPTIIGTFHVQNKSSRAWSARYGLWMPWWQGFSGDYGLHELPEWPNGKKEGESHLGTPVSHGCVRLGTGPAELVFNWTEVGTPVYIHK